MNPASTQIIILPQQPLIAPQSFVWVGVGGLNDEPTDPVGTRSPKIDWKLWVSTFLLANKVSEWVQEIIQKANESGWFRVSICSFEDK